MCPLAALSEWIALSGIADAPVFRRFTKGDQILTGRLSGDSIAATVKQRAAAIGVDPALYSGIRFGSDSQPVPLRLAFRCCHFLTREWREQHGPARSRKS